MGASKPLVKEINQYLNSLNTEQQKAVLTVVKAFAEHQHDEFWEDKAFIAELDRRTAGYENGKARVLSLEQVEAKVRKAYKAKTKAK